jgi:hypothetical protein
MFEEHITYSLHFPDTWVINKMTPKRGFVRKETWKMENMFLIADGIAKEVTLFVVGIFNVF